MGGGKGSGLFDGTVGSGTRYPGNDPTRSPGTGFEWRGQGNVRSQRGSWYNPSTGESWRADLNHRPPIRPHWDYRDSNGVEWRVFSDGTREQKR